LVQERRNIFSVKADPARSLVPARGAAHCAAKSARGAKTPSVHVPVPGLLLGGFSVWPPLPPPPPHAARPHSTIATRPLRSAIPIIHSTPVGFRQTVVLRVHRRRYVRGLSTDSGSIQWIPQSIPGGGWKPPNSAVTSRANAMVCRSAYVSPIACSPIGNFCVPRPVGNTVEGR